jgi:hypothetical protein
MTSPEIDTQVLPAKFVLQKWYLDCVTADGDAAIVYCADLSWRQIHLHYSSVLASRGCSVTSRTSMATFTAPAIERNRKGCGSANSSETWNQRDLGTICGARTAHNVRMLCRTCALELCAAEVRGSPRCCGSGRIRRPRIRRVSHSHPSAMEIADASATVGTFPFP